MHMHIHIYIYLHNSCMCAYATVQQLLCHGSYCKLILSLARTSCRLSFPPALLPLRRAGRPPASQFLKKSVQIHASSWRGRRCGVAQASSDHLRWCGPHPVCLWFTLAHVRGPHPRQESIFAAIFAGFIIVDGRMRWRIHDVNCHDSCAAPRTTFDFIGFHYWKQ